MLSGIWIALAVFFIGGERAARVTFALIRKLPDPFHRRPVAARPLKAVRRFSTPNPRAAFTAQRAAEVKTEADERPEPGR